MKRIYLFLFLLVTTLVVSQVSAQKRLFILLGQSNMAGRAPIEDVDSVALPMVKLLNADGHCWGSDMPLPKPCRSNCRILYFL